jgi:hypothetical protein
MENVVIFYDHLEYFMAIWHNVWQFGKVCGHLVYFSLFGMFGPRKIWQPWSTFTPNLGKDCGISHSRILNFKQELAIHVASFLNCMYSVESWVIVTV